MSVATLTTVAAVRNLRAPTSGDTGKAKPTRAEETQPAKLRELLVSQVPTEVVAPYTAVTAIVVGFVAKPTTNNPNPDDYVEVRWALLVLAVVAAAALIGIRGWKKQTSSPTRVPWLEITGGSVAAFAWAFLLPESPLTASIDSVAYKAIVPAGIAFVAILGNVIIAELLKSAADGSPPPPPPED